LLFPSGIGRVTDENFVIGDAQVVGGVIPQVFVGEEKYALGTLETPGKGLVSVGGRANQPAVVTDKSLQRSRGIHIGNRNRICAADMLPGISHSINRGHVGHRTAGVQVGQEDTLTGAAQDAGGFGHKMHPTKDDILGLFFFGGTAGEIIGITDNIPQSHDFLTLVVMGQDDQFSSQSFTVFLNDGPKLIQ